MDKISGKNNTIESWYLSKIFLFKFNLKKCPTNAINQSERSRISFAQKEALIPTKKMK